MTDSREKEYIYAHVSVSLFFFSEALLSLAENLAAVECNK